MTELHATASAPPGPPLTLSCPACRNVVPITFEVITEGGCPRCARPWEADSIPTQLTALLDLLCGPPESETPAALTVGCPTCRAALPITFEVLTSGRCPRCDDALDGSAVAMALGAFAL